MFNHFVKILLMFIAVINFSGCATAPPPPECKGEFRPINTPEKVVEVSQ